MTGQLLLRDQIDRRIEEFLADEDPRFAWVRTAAQRFGFLPLYLGWFAVLGVKPDGALVRWDNEDDPKVLKPLSNPLLGRMALCQGAKKYPECPQGEAGRGGRRSGEIRPRASP